MGVRQEYYKQWENLDDVNSYIMFVYVVKIT